MQTDNSPATAKQRVLIFPAQTPKDVHRRPVDGVSAKATVPLTTEGCQDGQKEKDDGELVRVGHRDRTAAGLGTLVLSIVTGRGSLLKELFQRNRRRRSRPKLRPGSRSAPWVWNKKL